MRIETFGSTIFPDWCSNTMIAATTDDAREMRISNLFNMLNLYQSFIGANIEEKVSMPNTWIYFKLWIASCVKRFHTPLILFGAKRCQNWPNGHIYILEIGMLDTLTGHREKFCECMVEDAVLKLRCQVCPVEITIDKLDNN